MNIYNSYNYGNCIFKERVVRSFLIVQNENFNMLKTYSYKKNAYKGLKKKIYVLFNFFFVTSFI